MNWAALIAALIAVESGGDSNAVGDRGMSVGVLQIQAGVVDDVNRVWRKNYAWPDDARDPVKAQEICKLYLAYWTDHYAKTHGPADESVAARIWNGGPYGYAKRGTNEYWRRVKAAMQKR